MKGKQAALRNNIAGAIETVVGETGKTPSKKAKKVIEKSAKKLVKKLVKISAKEIKKALKETAKADKLALAESFKEAETAKPVLSDENEPLTDVK